MLGMGDTQGPGNGAITSNSFAWTNAARTVTFWWRAESPNTNANDGTFNDAFIDDVVVLAK